MTQYQLTLDPTVLQRLFTSSDGQFAHLLGALLIEHDEAWSTDKCYVDMTASWQWRAAGRHEPQEGGPTLPA